MQISLSRCYIVSVTNFAICPGISLESLTCVSQSAYDSLHTEQEGLFKELLQGLFSIFIIKLEFVGRN